MTAANVPMQLPATRAAPAAWPARGRRVPPNRMERHGHAVRGRKCAAAAYRGLPDEILAKKKQGFELQFWVRATMEQWLQSHDR